MFKQKHIEIFINEGQMRQRLYGCHGISYQIDIIYSGKVKHCLKKISGAGSDEYCVIYKKRVDMMKKILISLLVYFSPKSPNLSSRFDKINDKFKRVPALMPQRVINVIETHGQVQKYSMDDTIEFGRDDSPGAQVRNDDYLEHYKIVMAERFGKKCYEDGHLKIEVFDSQAHMFSHPFVVKNIHVEGYIVKQPNN